MATTRTLVTADELLEMPDDGFRYELLKGEVRRMPPAGSEHGAIEVRLTVALGSHVESNSLGVVFGAETGFRISSNPDTVRAPDIAFVRQDRIPEDGLPQGFWPGAPDLAVEVISPSDIYAEVEEKVNQWLEAGTRMVIIVNPRTKMVTVYTSTTQVTRLTEANMLDGGDVVPGFSYPVARLFA